MADELSMQAPFRLVVGAIHASPLVSGRRPARWAARNRPCGARGDQSPERGTPIPRQCVPILSLCPIRPWVHSAGLTFGQACLTPPYSGAVGDVGDAPVAGSPHEDGLGRERPLAEERTRCYGSDLTQRKVRPHAVSATSGRLT